MAIIFIMKKLAKSHPLLSSMLSTPDKVIDITNKTLDNNGPEVTTDGHPDLDPIWIQAAHLQLATNDWSKMTFDPAFGLETAPPKPPGPVQDQLPLGQSPKPSGPFQDQPLLDDEDLLVPLPEAIIANVNPAKLETVPQDGLDKFTPVPVTSTGKTGQLSRHCPITKKPTLVHPTNKDNARTHQPQFQNLQKPVEQRPAPSCLRPRIPKETEFNKAKAPKMSPRKAKTPISKKVLPAKKGVKKPTNAFLAAMVKPGFNHPELRKMYGLMKKLDSENPILTTSAEAALMMAQQRQQWLQALNVLMANLNKRESGSIFALYHRHPFPRFPNPVVSENIRDTNNNSCESNHFLPAC